MINQGRAAFLIGPARCNARRRRADHRRRPGGRCGRGVGRQVERRRADRKERASQRCSATAQGVTAAAVASYGGCRSRCAPSTLDVDRCDQQQPDHEKPAGDHHAEAVVVVGEIAAPRDRSVARRSPPPARTMSRDRRTRRAGSAAQIRPSSHGRPIGSSPSRGPPDWLDTQNIADVVATDATAVIAEPQQ